MDQKDTIRKKLQTVLKLSGFYLRSEFCNSIIDQLYEANTDLSDPNQFDNCIKSLCESFENQCIAEQSIESHHVEQAVDKCIHSGYEKNETIFNVINAFDMPRLTYDADRKQYVLNPQKPNLLPNASAKAQLFLERYHAILHRTKRNFRHKILDNEKKITLQTVDYVLTLSEVNFQHTLILGALLEQNDGKYYLEDPTGIVQLDLSRARFYGGFFVENCFVLVNGHYEDKVLQVSKIILPPGEEYADSRPSFGTINYFGGPSSTLLKDSIKLRQDMHKNEDELMMFFSDVWLDNPDIFDKLDQLFSGFQAKPPIAFIFIGNFMSKSYRNETNKTLQGLFKRLGDLINNYPSLVNQSNFVFVPGSNDPCIAHMVPRLALPEAITGEITKIFDKAIFATNPCRIQYCTKEIVVFKADILPKLLQGSLYKPPKEEYVDNLVRTIISQGHLSPFSVYSLPVYWDFDYTLRLFPVPDLVVIGDKSELYKGDHKGCYITNPGPFCESNFCFSAYTPATNSINNCSLGEQNVVQ